MKEKKTLSEQFMDDKRRKIQDEASYARPMSQNQYLDWINGLSLQYGASVGFKEGLQLLEQVLYLVEEGIGAEKIWEYIGGVVKEKADTGFVFPKFGFNI